MINRPRRKYTEEHISFLRLHYRTCTMKELTKHFNETFNMTCTEIAIQSLVSHTHINPNRKGRKYTEEHIEFLRKWFPIYDINTLHPMFIKEFNVSITKKSLYALCERHGIKAGRTGQFVKGSIPHCKGKPQNEWMSSEAIERTKSTRFQKGKNINNSNHNELPVGSEFIESGYIRIKTDERNGQSSHPWWKWKHHVVWEQHYGPIPKGHKIIFLDGNPLNCDISNLKCVSESVHLKMNQNRYYNHTPEITEAGIAVCESEIACYKLKKGK